MEPSDWEEDESPDCGVTDGFVLARKMMDAKREWEK